MLAGDHADVLVCGPRHHEEEELAAGEKVVLT